MLKRILIDASKVEETRVVIHKDNAIEEFDYETEVKEQIKRNIYLVKVTRVEPSLQAAFIEYGSEKQGFLPFSEIHPDYYQIPVSDRQKSDEQGDTPDEATNLLNNNECPRDDIRFQVRSITPPDLTGDDAEEDKPEAEITTDLDTDPSTFTQKIEHETSLDSADDLEDQNFNEDESYDEQTEQPRNYNTAYRQYKIQEVIKRNQVILVQAIKEERGNKGAYFTSYISLAGRYCVLMPNSDRQGGVSRRIVDGEDRKRLKAIIDSLQVPPGSSVIVRTAGSGRSKSEIKKDYDYLVRLWNSICEHTLSAQAPAFIHAEGDLLKRTIRDSYDNTIDEILVQGEKAYRTAKDFMKMLIPTHVHKVKQFKGKVPIFIRYNVEEKLAALHNPVVILASGSYIVINHTEALISIDVNSGRSTSERNIEETATKTNLEAAHEIAKQLRLRDLSGLIVIDFIDMMEIRNRRIVEKTFRDLLQKNDRAKVQVGSISNFGLLEMSRQRIKPSFAELNTIACPNCKGKGTVRTPKANAMMILRTVESEVYKGNFSGTINVYTNIEVVGYLLNYCRHDIENLEQRYNITLLFYSDSYTISDSFSIEKAKVNSVAKVVNVPITSDTSYHIEDEDNIVEKKPYTRAKTISYNDEKIEKEHSDIPKNVIAKKEDEVQPIQEGNTPRRGSRYKKQGRFARNKYESRENKPKDQRLDERKSRRRPEQYVSKQSAAEKGGKEPTNSKPSSNILKDLWNKILSG